MWTLTNNKNEKEQQKKNRNRLIENRPMVAGGGSWVKMAKGLRNTDW